MAGRGMDTNTVFIGNIAYDVTERQLGELMEQAGPVKSLRIVLDRDTGKPKGYGFCEFYDRATAESAFRNLQGADVGGRALRIDYAEGNLRGPGTVHRDDYLGPDRRGGAGPRRDDMPPAPHFDSAPIQPGMHAVDAVDAAVHGMSKAQLYNIMAEMKSLIQANPAQARQVLIQQPQLTRALFQAQVLLGMVKPVDVPPPPHDGGVNGGAPPPMMQQPAAQPYGAPAGTQPPPMMQQPAGYGMQQPQQPVYQQPPPTAAGGAQPMMQPAAAAGAMPMQTQQPAAAVGATEQQRALLQQVMQLTPQQIEALPPTQKQQVLALQQQMRAQGTWM